MESPPNTPNLRVLRNRVVEKDQSSTPSKLSTPSKVTSEVSGITTRTSRRLSTKKENEISTDKLRPYVKMSKDMRDLSQEPKTPTTRGKKNIGESNKATESVVLQEKNTPRRLRMDNISPTEESNPSISPPKNIKVLLKDRSPTADEKAKSDLLPILENGDGSDDDSIIIENSFQLELDATDKTRDEIQTSPEDEVQTSPEDDVQTSPEDEVGLQTSPEDEVQTSPEDEVQTSLIKNTHPINQRSDLRSIRKETIQSTSTNVQGKNLAHSSPAESVGDLVVLLKPLDSDLEIVSVEKETSEIVSVEKESSEIVSVEKESNESVCREEDSLGDNSEKHATPNDTNDMVNSSIIQSTSGSSTSKKCASNSKFDSDKIDEIVEAVENDVSPSSNQKNICPENKSNSDDVSFELIDESQDSSPENSSLPIDTIERITEPVIQQLENAIVSNDGNSVENSTRINSLSDPLQCIKNSKGSANISPMKVINSPKSPLIGSLPENSSLPIYTIERITEPVIQQLENAIVSNDGNSVENSTRIDSLSDPLQCIKNSKGSPNISPMKVINSPKSSPLIGSSPGNNSSPHRMNEINKVTSPVSQSLSTGESSQSIASHSVISSSSSKKVVSNGVVSDKKISDIDDSDFEPRESPSNGTSRKTLFSKTASPDIAGTTKTKASPKKVMKLKMFDDNTNHYRLGNLTKLINNSSESPEISNAFKTFDKSQSTATDELIITRKDLTLVMKETINEALAGMRKDVLEIKKELSDLKTLRRKEEEEKAKILKEKHEEECSALTNRKKELVVEQLLAKQAAQIFSDCDSKKKKKSPKKTNECTKYPTFEKEMIVQSNSSSSEICSTLPVTHQPKLKKIKNLEVQEEDNKNIEEEEEDNLNLKVEMGTKHKRRKRKRESTVTKAEEVVIPTSANYFISSPPDVEPVEISNKSVDQDVESQKPKKKRSRKHKKKDQDKSNTETTNLSQVCSTETVDNDIEFSKKHKKKKLSLVMENTNEGCVNLNEFDQQPMNEEKKEKKKKKHLEQMYKVNQHVSPKNVSSNNQNCNEIEQSLNEEKKKKKKHLEQMDKFNRHVSPKNITSPNLNPVLSNILKIKKQNLKKKLKSKSNFNIDSQKLRNYLEENDILNPKPDKVKSNNFEDENNQVTKSKDAKKKKNKGNVNNSFELETGKKEVNHSKEKTQDSSYRLIPSSTLDVNNFWA